MSILFLATAGKFLSPLRTKSNGDGGFFTREDEGNI